VNSSHRLPVTAVILAGGRATRMGGTDKGLVELCGRPMIEHVLTALEPQVEHMFINANRNLERYAAFGCPVVTDADGEFLGPLAGLSAGLGSATTDLVLTVPCDCPLLVSDLARRLHTGLQQQDAEIAVPFDGERLQPVFALVQRKLADSLAAYLAGGDRKIDLWFARHRLARVDFSDCPENFINVNDPAERSALEARLMAGERSA